MLTLGVDLTGAFRAVIVDESGAVTAREQGHQADALTRLIVIISGDIAAATDLLLEPVLQECARRLPTATMDQLHVGFSALGGDAVAIGAARLAMSI
jgi:hypothetical protein